MDRVGHQRFRKYFSRDLQNAVRNFGLDVILRQNSSCIHLMDIRLFCPGCVSPWSGSQSNCECHALQLDALEHALSPNDIKGQNKASRAPLFEISLDFKAQTNASSAKSSAIWRRYSSKTLSANFAELSSERLQMGPLECDADQDEDDESVGSKRKRSAHHVAAPPSSLSTDCSKATVPAATATASEAPCSPEKKLCR